jgi:catechol 2,3-dioxygenase-like lactoylglutathione lyase family enzyme
MATRLRSFDPGMGAEPPVHELRLALTVDDFDGALDFYRDALGLPLLDAWAAPDGFVAILDAGRATLELLSPGQAATVDAIEVGERVAGPVRIALAVDDSAATADALEAAGAERLGGPVETPWRHVNVRLRAGRDAAHPLHGSRRGRALVTTCHKGRAAAG